jgi:uncharacterized membrane protein YgdD (TMEM256/DUF423 family)
MNPMNRPTLFLSLAGCFGLTAVVLGAFGAHALDARLQELGTKAVWETAVDYQMWHALAVLGLVALRCKGRPARAAGLAFCLGIPLFSGSLYWLALDGPRWLGPITPLGGLLFVIGWALFIVAVFRDAHHGQP